MGIIVRESLKTTIISYVGILIGTFNILWLAPKFLKPEEIGLTRILTDISFLLASFVQLGAANIADRFFPYFRNEKEKHHGFFLFLVVYPFFGFLIFTLLFLLFKEQWMDIYKDKSPLLNDFFYHIIPLTFFLMYTVVLEAYIRVHYQIAVPGIIREVYIRLAFSLVVILYFLKVINLDDLVLMLIISYGISVILLLGYIKKIGRLYLSFNKSFFKQTVIRDIGYFSLFVILGGAGSLIASKIDTIMLGSMTGLALTGVYSIAFYIGSIIEVPRRSIAQISVPLISQAWKNNDLDQIKDLYTKSALNQFIIGGLLFLLIWGNVDSLLSLIPNSEEYKDGKYVIFFVGLGRLINMGAGVNTEIIINSKYYKFYLISIVFLGVITFITNYIYIPIYGINGAAATTAFCILSFNIMNFVFLWIKIGMQPFTKKMAVAIFVFLLTYIFVVILDLKDSGILSTLLNITIKSFLICVIYLGIIYFFRISDDLYKVMSGVINKINFFRRSR